MFTKCFFSLGLAPALLFGVAAAVAPVQADRIQISAAPIANHSKPASTSSLPEGLHQVILDATAQPFPARVDGYRARMGGLEFILNADGLHVNDGGLAWEIALSGFGREGQIVSVSEAVETAQTDNCLEYKRAGLTEWYRDTALGVEHGFTIYQRPGGTGQLLLRLDLATDLEGVLNDDRRGLSFPTPDGQTLRYAHLRARDSNGTQRDAKLRYTPGGVEFQVDDQGAAYPITVGVIIYVEHKAIASEGTAGDQFGASVALSGDTALVGALDHNVGANSDQGAAYVFVRNGVTWTQQAELIASDGEANDLFGASVALSGDTALVGALWDDYGANTSQGSAYVFVRNGTTWTQQAKLMASNGAAYDYFGSSVALFADTALVGAPGSDVGSDTDEGSAYVFVRNGATWSEQAQLIASDGAASDNFGASVALSSDTALVGSDRHNSLKGAVCVFVRDGTSWSEQAQLTAFDGAEGDVFGSSVAISGDTALVGADGRDVDGNLDQGSAYVFLRNGTTWTQQGELIASNGAAHDDFGYSVALSGDTALVGAKMHDIAGRGSQGSAYVFMRSGTTWNLQQELTASDGAADDYFGWSVALSGDTAIVGASRDDVGINLNQGSAYIYMAKRSQTFLSSGPRDGWILESTETSDEGGALSSTAAVLRLGDNAQDKQYRAILHFNTSTLPDNAVITGATLMIKKQGREGKNPFTALGRLCVDMKKPFFGTNAGLEVGDFQASAGRSKVAKFGATPVSNWYSAMLNATGRAYVNKTGTTQFRLFFSKDDNDNNVADYITFLSGDYATAAARPKLIIDYYAP
jgi:hypothetical protein